MTPERVKKMVKIAVIAAVTIICALAVTILVQVCMKSSLQNREKMLLEQIEKTKAQMETIDDEIEYRKSADYIEKCLRELGYIKNGEIKFS